ncbi:extracellular solute-binding protein [Pelagibius sp. 7325]|uniref:extracellular solute-binding protein n=1 Tax=Pelagibius sp. 7325 TaxID=3131994 RepID=UPI0030EBC028
MTTKLMTRLLGGAVGGAAVIALAASPAAAADAELTVFDWAGYEDPGFHEAYTAKYNDSPTFAFFGDEEEAFQKLRAGFTADLAHPCSQSVVKWREAGLLKPLDTSRIAAWDDLNPSLRDLPGFSDGGKAYFLPVDWGNTALIYRADLIPKEDAQSLQVFADPKYQGRVAIGDSVDDAYALASLAIGVKDWATLTDAQFEEASEFLRKVHENVRLYWQDGATLAQTMSSGEVVLAWAWNDTALNLQAEGIDAVLNRDTKEGLSSWVCGYSLLAGSEGSEEKAYDFMNSVVSDEAAHYLVTSWGYGHANQTAMQGMDQAELASMGFDDFERFRANTLWQGPLPTELREKMIAEFEKIKAGF